MTDYDDKDIGKIGDYSTDGADNDGKIFKMLKEIYPFGINDTFLYELAQNIANAVLKARQLTEKTDNFMTINQIESLITDLNGKVKSTILKIFEEELAKVCHSNFKMSAFRKFKMSSLS